jgi:hypothetical protein
MAQDSIDVRTVAGRTILSLDSDRIAEGLANYRRESVDCLSVNSPRGYARRDLDFLRDAPDVTALEIVFPPAPPFDVSALTSVSGLRSACPSSP